MRKIMIIGATSAIAEATARLFARKGDRLFLVARNAERLHAMADDLRVRGADRVGTAVMDVLDYQRHADVAGEAEAELDGLDTVLVAHGTLPDQEACQRSFEQTRHELEINCLSVISLLTHLANRFEAQRYGTLAVVSSVAGDRGRQSNYVYGTSKAAVTSFLQGLRNRLYPAAIHVLTVKPGFVDTPMTTRFSKGPLWAKPETVAAGIYRAIERRRDVVYVPGFWRLVMLVIRAIPEPLFKRLKL